MKKRIKEAIIETIGVAMILACSMAFCVFIACLVRFGDVNGNASADVDIIYRYTLYAFLIVFTAVLTVRGMLIILYVTNKNVWDTVHENRSTENVLFALIPDVKVLAGLDDEEEEEV